MELLKFIRTVLGRKKITLGYMLKNRVAIGVTSSEEFYAFYDEVTKVAKEDKRVSVGVSREVWDIYMVRGDRSNQIMKQEGIMFMNMHRRHCMGFCHGEYFVKEGYQLLLYSEYDIEYTYDE